jgi:hypothetical protein
MSYQQHHTINEFIPNYTVKSDYLPTRVGDGNQTQTAEWVIIFLLCSSEDMKRKKEKEESSLKDQLNSTHKDTCHSEPTKMSRLTNQSLNNSSADSSEDDHDRFIHHYKQNKLFYKYMKRNQDYFIKIYRNLRNNLNKTEAITDGLLKSIQNYNITILKS